MRFYLELPDRAPLSCRDDRQALRLARLYLAVSQGEEPSEHADRERPPVNPFENVPRDR